MKKILLILCLCSVFTAYAGDNTTAQKKNGKAVENVQTKKKEVKARGKTENITKWTNWSKIKDLFM